MDMKILQAILGHLNPVNTLASYVEPDTEDVKREFAKVDLVGEFKPTRFYFKKDEEWKKTPTKPADLFK